MKASSTRFARGPMTPHDPASVVSNFVIAKDGCLCPDHGRADGWLRAADHRAERHEQSPHGHARGGHSGKTADPTDTHLTWKCLDTHHRDSQAAEVGCPRI